MTSLPPGNGDRNFKARCLPALTCRDRVITSPGTAVSLPWSPLSGGALLRLDDIVVSVVKELKQIRVEALKAATGGKLPPEAAGTIKQSAIAAVKAQLGPAGLAELASTLGLAGDAVDKLLSTKVEAAVYGIRHASTTNGAHSPGAFVPFTS
jgi:hypothetical protein